MKTKFRILGQILLGVIYIAMLTYFTIQSLKNGNASNETSSTVANVAAMIIEWTSGQKVTVDESFCYAVRKWIGHYGYFVALGGVSSLFYYSFQRQTSWLFSTLFHFISGIVFAFFTEFVCQAIASGRYPSLNDVGMDYLGFISLSIIISLVFFFLWRKSKKKEA